MAEFIDVLISTEELHKRIKEVAQEINNDYANKQVTLVGTLKGAVMFMVDLSKELTCDVKFDFIDVSSYHGGTETSGKVVVNKDLEHDIEDCHVIVIEDIVDTGHSLKTILDMLKDKNPASLKVCSLLNKPERREVEGIEIDYLGFTIENKFVVGYGLDYDQRLRNLDYVGVMRFE